MGQDVWCATRSLLQRCKEIRVHWRLVEIIERAHADAVRRPRAATTAVRSALRHFLSTELPNFIPDDSWSELSREDDHESAGVCNDGDGEVEETRTRPQHGETPPAGAPLPPPAVTFVPVAPPSHPPALMHHITVPLLAPPLHTGCWGPPAAASGARFAHRPAPPPTHHVTMPTAAPVPTHTTAARRPTRPPDASRGGQQLCAAPAPPTTAVAPPLLAPAALARPSAATHSCAGPLVGGMANWTVTLDMEATATQRPRPQLVPSIATRQPLPPKAAAPPAAPPLVNRQLVTGLNVQNNTYLRDKSSSKMTLVRIEPIVPPRPVPLLKTTVAQTGR
mmetsp:Transcript_40176/g.114543  ORF Transcript_40176/g.114543 Transcript_40176/m.114543 type:complete len:335 (+) Transcript_40176:136-1140(+)